MNKPFDLEAFKSGQKALTRDGRIATFLAICADCSIDFQLIVLLEGIHKPTTCGLDGRRTQSTTEIDDADLVSMVFRHQALIDAYNPEDTWQVHTKQSGVWITIKEPDFDDLYEWRLHPHNDLIKAHKKGAKIEVFSYDGVSPEPYWYNDPNPAWDEHLQYRIKPTTKTVYEWLLKAPKGNCWFIGELLMTEEEVDLYYDGYSKTKTGRSWEVEV